VAKAEWGTKIVCSGCEARFYDLRRKEPECPTCGTKVKPKKKAKPKEGPAELKDVPKTPAPKAAAPEADAGDPDLVADDDSDLILTPDDDDLDDDPDADDADDDDDVLEDASDLGGDDSDMSEVIETVEEAAAAKD